MWRLRHTFVCDAMADTVSSAMLPGSIDPRRTRCGPSSSAIAETSSGRRFPSERYCVMLHPVITISRYPASMNARALARTSSKGIETDGPRNLGTMQNVQCPEHPSCILRYARAVLVGIGSFRVGLVSFRVGLGSTLTLADPRPTLFDPGPIREEPGFLRK